MFDDDVWDFANVIGLPMQMPLHVRRLDFTMIVNLPWRMVAKELVFALLVPWHEAVAPLPRPYRSPRTLRRPARPLTYHAAHRMFERVNERAGTTATLHSLRHTAAYRMAEDPTLPLTDVQLCPRARTTHNDSALSDATQGRRGPPGACPSRPADPAGDRACPTGACAWLPARVNVLFGHDAS
jgi:hypothetical protein